METFLSSLTFACLIAGQVLAVVYAYQARVRDRNGSGTDAWLGVREPQRSRAASAKPVAIALVLTTVLPVAAATPLPSAAVRELGSSPMAGLHVLAASQLGNPAPNAVVRSGPPLFFGFLEYDANPDAPGGVHGFSPLPSDDAPPR